MTNISKEIREARLRWLGHVERKTEKDVVMRTWKWVENRKGYELEMNTERRSKRLENVEIDNLMHQPQIWRRRKK